MSTPSKIKISDSYPVSQVEAEIAWIEREMVRVLAEAERRPSKRKHLTDLQRQRADREKMLSDHRDHQI